MTLKKHHELVFVTALINCDGAVMNVRLCSEVAKMIFGKGGTCVARFVICLTGVDQDLPWYWVHSRVQTCT